MTVENIRLIWIVAVVFIVVIYFFMIARARAAASRGFRFNRAELDAIVQRYLSQAGVERNVAALHYKVSDDFKTVPSAEDTAFVGLKNNALAIAIRMLRTPGPGVPLPKPLTRLKETIEARPGLPDKEPKGRILSSTFKNRSITRMVEVDVEQGPWGRIRNIAFYGPDSIYTIDMGVPGTAENHQALLPLIEAFLDNLRFDEAALGAPLDDSALSSVGTPYEGRPLVVRSPFPAADESGCLLCKSCGMPFESTAADAREYYEALVRRDQRLILLCGKCDSLSVFLEAEVKAGSEIVNA